MSARAPHRKLAQGRTRTPRSQHYHVYVVELAKDVLYLARFRKSNPDYVPGKPCVYVGMTGLDPDVRFDKHKAGIQANRYVKDYGLRLRPDLYACYNPMPYDGACDMEVELAIALREQGYGVWQA
jgi:predicted GIY-YIG superfamily endonuclease